MTYKEQLLNYQTIPSLNGWRAIAILFVIIGHLKFNLLPNTILYKIIDHSIFANLGVRIFFVLSGFLITTLLFKEKLKYGRINIQHFFIRRFLRIVPVLWLYLLVVAILNLLLNFNLTISQFLISLFYLNNFYPNTWLLGHTWSLSVEEQFYLLWPFLFSFINKLQLLNIIILIVSPIIITIVYFKPDWRFFLLEQFFTPASAIFSGALLAIIWLKNFYNIKMSSYLTFPFFVGVCILIYIVTILKQYGIMGTLLYPGGDSILNICICYLILFSIVTKHGVIFKILNNNILVKIGVLSYSLYIWQQLFIIPIDLYPNWRKFFIFPLNLFAAIFVAYISYHYFEKRFLKIKYKFSKN